MTGPLIVQSDKTLLLEVDHPDAPAARRAIAPFAERPPSPASADRAASTSVTVKDASAAGSGSDARVLHPTPTRPCGVTPDR